MESKPIQNFHRRMIQDFMDIIILNHLKNNHDPCGYDLVKYFHRKFHMLPSSGTVYSLLHSLERKDLITGHQTQRKRVYKLTIKGEDFLKEIHHQRDQIQAFLSNLFSQDTQITSAP